MEKTETDYAELETRQLASLTDDERMLIRGLMAERKPVPEIDHEALAKSLVNLSAQTVEVKSNMSKEDNEIVVQAAGDTAAALKEIIAQAKAGDRRALHKLEAFETYNDPQLAARVALMNNKQRRAFKAGRKGKNRSGRGGR